MKRVLLVLTLVLLVGAGYFGWTRYSAHPTSNQSASTAPQKVPVRVATVKTTDFQVWLDGLGQVAPYQTVQVRSRVDGQIEKIFIKEGQNVKAGDPLVLIDPRPYQAALDQAKAKLAQDQANLANANLDLQRYTELVQRGAGPRQQLDTQQATVKQLGAQLQADQAAIDSAQTQLDYTTIKAPINGRTGFLNIDLGNVVHAADTTALFTIAQIQPISVVFTAPEGNLQEIAQAAAAGPVEVRALSADGGTTLSTGKLETINNQVDPATGTIQIKATFANADGKLWPGLSVDTKMLVATRKNVVVVPAAAVQHGPDDKLFAYVVQNGTAHVRDIELAEIGNGQGVVSKGLHDGDEVVTAGQYRLKDGSAVTIDTQAVAQNGAP